MSVIGVNKLASVLPLCLCWVRAWRSHRPVSGPGTEQRPLRGWPSRPAVPPGGNVGWRQAGSPHGAGTQAPRDQLGGSLPAFLALGGHPGAGRHAVDVSPRVAVLTPQQGTGHRVGSGGTSGSGAGPPARPGHCQDAALDSLCPPVLIWDLSKATLSCDRADLSCILFAVSTHTDGPCHKQGYPGPRPSARMWYNLLWLPSAHVTGVP